MDMKRKAEEEKVRLKMNERVVERKEKRNGGRKKRKERQ